MDLFAGCGGISLGFQKAGFDISASAEIDELAAQSHALNFFGSRVDDFAPHSTPIDITEFEPLELLERFGLSTKQSQTSVIVGGPPCQSFARVGRAKLREIMDHPKAFSLDPRKDLYLRFIEYVLAIRPAVVLMENVPDVMNSGGHNVPEETCEVLSENGYDCGYTLLNSAFYGVPQMRLRMFLLAWKKEFSTPITFPKPTHWIELPIGYEGSTAVALKKLREKQNHPLWESTECFYVHPPEPSANLIPAITAKEAIGDLPPITTHLSGELKRGTRRFDELSRYRNDIQPSPYAIAMRNWHGFASQEGVYDHVIRSLPRDYPIFRRMKHGDQYPEAFKLANKMLEERIAALRLEGVDIGKTLFEKLKKEIVPPYDPSKFPNKWRKMEPDKPARTLLAHLGKDGYSHIHYDSAQARTISVREAARLQSFPDGFVFSGTMNPAFRQIGNAVPPLMAYALAKHIKLKIGKYLDDKTNRNKKTDRV